MLTTLLRTVIGGAFLGSLFWFSDRDWVGLLLLAVWTVAIGAMIHSNLAERFLWIPLALALTGLFSSIIVLAIPANITLAANLVTIVLFLVSLEVLKRQRSLIALVRLRAPLKASP